MTIDFFKKYFVDLHTLSNSIKDNDLKSFSELLLTSNNNGGKVIIFGNGGSSSIASHVSIDLNKAAGIESLNFNDPTLITCFANDYGYENWVSEVVKIHCKPKDVVIFISSSGMSLNLINGIKCANSITNTTVTFTGFDKDNTLSKLGFINFWVDSQVYNYIELVHSIWILSAIDFIIDRKNKNN